MHPLIAQSFRFTNDVIGAAIELHKEKRAGLLESIFEWCPTMVSTSSESTKKTEKTERLFSVSSVAL
jgi:hypothetical protein